MRNRTRVLLAVGVCLTVFGLVFGQLPILAQADPSPHAHIPPPSPDGPVGLIGRRSLDLDGRLHLLGLGDTARPLVLVFLDTACPISTRYAPYLNELFRQADAAQLDFYGVISAPQVTPQDARQFRDQYQLRYPLLFDSSGDLALALRPQVVPEVFVIDPSDRLVYRGRIDAWFTYDNSVANSDNPHSPPERIRWGWQSTDEMCEFYLTAVTDDPRDERRLAAAERASWRRSAEVRKR